MIFTFERRKKLNRLLREQLPGYRFEEDKEGVPRMRINRLPAGAAVVDNTHTLTLMAYRYREELRMPIPVFLVIGQGRDRTVEVNYFDHRSPISLREAAKYTSEKRLYVLDLL